MTKHSFSVGQPHEKNRDNDGVESLVDTREIRYNVDKKLGGGGQGDVFLLEGGKHIAKLFKSKDDPTKLKAKVNFLRNLNLDKDIFALPLREVAQPGVGYVAEFAGGMDELAGLYLEKKPPDKTAAAWLVESGGLWKRYRMLASIASALKILHSKGLVYCDLSPKNIFVSSSPLNANVFFIDLDNLTHKVSLRDVVYTPRYGAPEIVTRKAPNTMESDCHAFAVIAYELLVSGHPLIGDYVDSGDPELEEDAFAGKIPWVDHSKDDLNRRTTGLPSDFVISSALMPLFKRSFEEGLGNPGRRPSMAEWFEQLTKATNELIKCGNPDCALHFPYKKHRCCPFCKTKAEMVTRIQMRRWDEVGHYDPEGNIITEKFAIQPEIYDEIFIDANTPKEIAACNFLIEKTPLQLPVLRIEQITEKGETKFRVKPLNGKKFRVSRRTGEKTKDEISTEKKIKIGDPGLPDSQKSMLHVEDLDVPQRVLIIDKFEEK
ncbi:MAG: protein kinase [Puniceicoccales bacterium]|nr:protein kinase [Puniceicoccales bacterium]